MSTSYEEQLAAITNAVTSAEVKLLALLKSFDGQPKRALNKKRLEALEKANLRIAHTKSALRDAG